MQQLSEHHDPEMLKQVLYHDGMNISWIQCRSVHVIIAKELQYVYISSNLEILNLVSWYRSKDFRCNNSDIIILETYDSIICHLSKQSINNMFSLVMISTDNYQLNDMSPLVMTSRNHYQFNFSISHHYYRPLPIKICFH